MKDRILIDPGFGDAIVHALEVANDRECRIVLIAIPMDGDALGQPAFCSNFEPDQMEEVIIQIAAQIPRVSLSRVIEGDPQ